MLNTDDTEDTDDHGLNQIENQLQALCGFSP